MFTIQRRNLLLSTIAILLFLTPVVMRAQGPSEVNHDLARVRAATAKYHDINIAIADGYGLLAPGVCVEGPNGAIGFHYVKPSRFVSTQRIIEEPEILIYFPTGDNELRLVAVEYATRALYRDTRPPDTPGYRAGTFPWQQPVIPPYIQEVAGPFTLFGENSEGPFFQGRWLYYLHVWAWQGNPDGLFADFNPSLDCP